MTKTDLVRRCQDLECECARLRDALDATNKQLGKILHSVRLARHEISECDEVESCECDEVDSCG